MWAGQETGEACTASSTSTRRDRCAYEHAAAGFGIRCYDHGAATHSWLPGGPAYRFKRRCSCRGACDRSAGCPRRCACRPQASDPDPGTYLVLFAQYVPRSRSEPAGYVDVTPAPCRRRSGGGPTGRRRRARRRSRRRVSLPGDPVVGRDETREQRGAPDGPDERPAKIRATAIEDAAREQVGRVAEHDPAGANRHERDGGPAPSFQGAISHVSRPPTKITNSVTRATWRAPGSAMITSMNTNGIVFSIRCWKLA